MAAQKLSGIMSVDTALENTEHDLYKIFLYNCGTPCIHELTTDSDSGRMSMITFHSLGGLRRKIRTKLIRAAVTKAKKNVLTSSFS